MSQTPTRSKLPPLERLRQIEGTVHHLTTGDLHGWATKADIETLNHLEIKLRALRHALESRVERASVRRTKPCP